MAFTKMKPLCDLEERHGVDLGAQYKTISLALHLSATLLLTYGIICWNCDLPASRDN